MAKTSDNEHPSSHGLFLAFAAALMVAASVARGAVYWPELIAGTPLMVALGLTWLAGFALIFFGQVVLRESPVSALQGATLFFRGFPRWLALVGVLVLILLGEAVASVVTSRAYDLGTTPDGVPVRSRSLVQEGDLYFAILNGTTKIPVSRAEYLQDLAVLAQVLTSAGLLMAYMALVLWHYLWRRERAHRANTLVPSLAPPEPPRREPLNARATASHEGKVRTVALAVWSLVIMTAVPQGLGRHDMPDLPFLPTGFPYVLAAIAAPALVLLLGVPRSGKNPFDIDLVREWVTARYGVSTYEAYFRAIRPLTLFSVFFVLGGALQLTRALIGGQSILSLPAGDVLMLSYGAALAACVVTLRRRGNALE